MTVTEIIAPANLDARLALDYALGHHLATAGVRYRITAGQSALELADAALSRDATRIDAVARGYTSALLGR